MIAMGIFREHFQPRMCSGKKIPKTGHVKGNGKNVVLIDIDGDQFDDVVIIDVPGFLQQKLHGSRVPRDRKCPIQSVISIDDDDSDDTEHPGTVNESGGELDSDASSSRRFSPAPGYTRNSVHVEVDDCHVVHEKGSASNLPNHWKKGSAKASERNRYGLDDSESGSFEGDCSDCEVIDVCELWEKASVKRKRHEFNDQAGFDEQASSSGLQSDIYTHIEVATRTGQHASCLVENEKPTAVGDALHAQDGVTTSEDRDIINKREKLKETDDYKQAIEEEWASRQRQLQIQAEEAQRLRKRKKAESQRLLDMQRRQKERIEEVREIQKKDEENLNMKEQLRAEIREGLNKLEMTCIDMASLLRCLGIQVGGGCKPLPHQVHTAYRQALLKFHPDRASKADIREQVEAEEKFKLISRMKEKFLSCY